MLGPSLTPGLQTLGWDKFTRAKPEGLGAHRHDAYEICLLLDGAVEWWAEAETFSLRRGDLYFTRPGEWHGGADAVMHPCEIFWLIITPPEIPGLTSDESEGVCAALNADGPRRFPAPPGIAEDFASLVAEHRAGDAAFAAASARAAVNKILVETARTRNAARAETPEVLPLSPEIAAAIGWMTERLGEPFCVQDAAATVGLHPSRFHERFVAEIGETPAEWRSRRRITEARQRLSLPNARITEIAFSLGFPSSQHFATTFKKYVGRTPTEFRRKRDEAGDSPRSLTGDQRHSP